MASINVLIELDDGQVKKTFKALEKTADKSSKVAADKISKNLEGDKVFGNLNAQLGSLRAAFGAVATAATAALAGSRVINAALEQEKAVEGLNAALRQTGSFSEAASQDLQNFASALQEVSINGDEVILGQLAIAKSFGATNEQAKTILQAATDLSAGLGISLESAVRLTSKTLGGLGGELNELVPEIRNLTREQFLAGEAITLVAGKFDGLAKEQLGTTAANLTQLSNAFGDVLESLGQFVTKSPAASSILNTLKDAAVGAKLALDDIFVREQQKNAEETQRALNLVKVEILDLEQAIKRAQTFTPGQVPILQQQIANLTEERKKLEAQLTTQAAAEEKQAAAAKKTEEQTRKTRQAEAERLANSKFATEQLQQLGLTRSQILEQEEEKKLGILQEAFNRKIISEAEYEQRRSILQQQFSEQRDALQEQRDAEEQAKIEEQINSTDNLFDNLGLAFKETAKTFRVTSKQIASTALNVVASGVGRAFDSVGRAIANGANAFDAFKDALKGVLGDIASATGDLFIKQGIGFLITNPAVGAGLIAAGAGLKVLGGFLGASSGGAAGGDAAVAAGASTPLAPTEDAFEGPREEERQLNQSVNVNINGDIVGDGSETALRISELLSNAFDEQGIIVRTRTA